MAEDNKSSLGVSATNNNSPITGKLDEKYRQAKSARRLLEPQW
jgi:hypothetical protein